MPAPVWFSPNKPQELNHAATPTKYSFWVRFPPLGTSPAKTLLTTSNPNTNTMTKLELTGRWNQLKGNIKQKWAQLTDDDLLFEEGKEEEVIGRIQLRTGETKESIRDFIAKL